MLRFVAFIAAAAAVSSIVAQRAEAQPVLDATFTYQGRLDAAGAPYTGEVDMRFGLYVDEGATLPGSAVIDRPGVEVQDGLFSIELDFGHDVLTFRELYLGIWVRTGGEPYTLLTPLNLLRPAPVALQAAGARTFSNGNVAFANGGVQFEISQLADENETTLTSLWQSFTMPQPGLPTAIWFGVGSTTGTDPVVRLYRGEGTGGQLLYTANPFGGVTFGNSAGFGDLLSFNIREDVPLKAGEVFTVEIDGASRPYKNSDLSSYPLGRSSLRAGNDLKFRLFYDGLNTPVASVTADGRFTAQEYRIEGAQTGMFSDGSVQGSQMRIRDIGARLEISNFGGESATISLQNTAEVIGGSVDFWTINGSLQDMWIDNDSGRAITIERDPTRVGIGFDGPPLATVHVQPGGLGFGAAALNSDDMIVESSDAVLGLYSNDGLSYGSAVVLAEVTGGNLVNKWGIVRETINAGNDLQFRFGTGANYAANDLKFEVRDTGDIWSQGQLFQNSSGKNKRDVADLRNALDTLLRLRGVSYTWKNDGSADIGFIAEEMAEIIPQIVDFDEDGLAVGIDYGRVTALLVEAVKEQAAEIEALRSRDNEQSDRLDHLEEAVAELLNERGSR